jgi:hypothetical protein
MSPRRSNLKIYACDFARFEVSIFTFCSCKVNHTACALNNPILLVDISFYLYLDSRSCTNSQNVCIKIVIRLILSYYKLFYGENFLEKINNNSIWSR